MNSIETDLPLVLIVDDQPENLDVLVNHLQDAGLRLIVALNGKDALSLATEQQPDLILLDIMMPQEDGFDVCKKLKATAITHNSPIIFMSALSDTQSKVKGFQSGAVDYITKPFQREEVLARVSTHITLAKQKHQLTSQLTELEALNNALHKEIQQRTEAESNWRLAQDQLTTLHKLEAQIHQIEGFIGESPAIKQLLDEVQQLQQFTDTHVLVLGESGTGKELISRAIHYGSSRKQAPFIAVNCSSIPAELADSEFFGHKKGAFTGASHDHHGFFAQADGGTLFLDEVGDLPLPLQAKLLRVLEDGWVTPIGSQTKRQVNVRIVAATNVDLASKIQQQLFRADLYYRLASYPLQLPPLRDRKEDIPLLVEHFLRTISRHMGRNSPAISADALAVLCEYPYPGNVRELKNLIEYALIRSRDQIIEPVHLHFPQLQPFLQTSRTDYSRPFIESALIQPSTQIRYDHEEVIMAYARRHGRIDNTAAQTILKIDHGRASYLLKKLNKEAKLVRHGERRWAYYEPA